MRIFLFTIFASISISVQAQYKIAYATYDWDETFDRVKYDASAYADKAATIMLDRTVAAYKHYETRKREIAGKIYHKISWIQDESAIEELNRLYLYESESVMIESIKVRTINKAGDVVTVDESKMEDVTKDEGNSNYRILAIPGIEVESWVEIFIHYKGLGQQNRFTLTEPFYVVHSDVIFQLFEYTPPYGYIRQTPRIKAYNGYERVYDKDRFNEPAVYKEKEAEADTTGKKVLFAQPGNDDEDDVQGTDKFKADLKKLFTRNTDDTIKDQVDDTYYHFAINGILPTTDAKYAHGFESCPRVDITLRSFYWTQISSGLLDQLEPATDTKISDARISRKTLKEINAIEVKEIDKLIAVEEFIKQQITSTESEDRSYESVTAILKDRVANELGLLRTYMALFDHADIEYEMYFVADKDYIKPDLTLPMTMGFSNYLFYFPNSKMYIAPTSKFYRVGAIPNYLSGCPSLKIMRFPKDEIMKDLPKSDKKYNVESTFSTIQLDVEKDLVQVDLMKRYFGDRAIVSRGFMNFMDDLEKEDYARDVLVSRIKDAELTKVVVTNDGISYNSRPKDSLSFRGLIQTEDMLTAVGSDYLFNLTKVIGSQSSFYGNSERSQDLYLEAAKIYEHKIKFIIPEGYELEGVDALDFDRSYFSMIKAKGSAEKSVLELIASFNSTASIWEGVLTVNVYETYEEGFYPKEDLQAFQNVINAAYEFYTVKLKLTKK
ncbi:MAG: hypothetical protein ACI837_002008 [Crocinitomicaceae bacterium]|jgi:hypothetical protein